MRKHWYITENWKLVLVPNPLEWQLGKVTIGFNWRVGYGYCFGPIEFQRWFV